MEGIVETTEAFLFIEALGNAVVHAKANGTFDYEDLGELIPLAEKAREAAVGIKNVGKELKDLNSEEIQVLSQSLAKAVAAIAEAILA